MVMDTHVAVSRFPVCKYSIHRDFLKKCNAQDLEDFGHTSLDSQFLLHYHYQHVDAQGNPDLCLDGVYGQSPSAEWQSIDAQRLPASSNRKQSYSHRTYYLDSPYSNFKNS